MENIFAIKFFINALSRKIFLKQPQLFWKHGDKIKKQEKKTKKKKKQCILAYINHN